MIPSVLIKIVFGAVLLLSTYPAAVSSTSIVIEVKGDCAITGERVAHEHGYRYVRQIFDGFCEIEEDPLSVNHHRHRRAIEQGVDPARMLLDHRHVEWAESQIPKKRLKREYVFNDPQWTSMWYLVRHSQMPSLPDLNVTGAWLLGYTGRGQVVTFLDDGLEYDHPDLQENYDKEASTDINGNDDDPTPRYEPTNENKHGTRCAGEVAAKINNHICGVGIAYHARVGGIRMLDGDVTDSVEARSLSHRPDHVHIYSASWGPDDNGLVVDGPGRLAKKAFENGALHGRDGKGSIFVWASGNGGRQSDSCACDGYITSIYTIAISATTEHGDKPWYLEECSATLASAYSSGQSNAGERDILTTDLNHACTSHHTGTSAAAPLAAAIYALVLEANPSLTWRDIMHITVLGSRAHAIPSNTNLVRNAAGFNVSSRFGFGLMDAGLMTWYANGWKNVPPMSTCESAAHNSSRLIAARSNQVFLLDLSECRHPAEPVHEVNYIEQVQVFVTLYADRRGDIEIYLYSPSNTRTQLLPRRERDQSNKGFHDWPFLTVQLWGEVPHGPWKLQVVNTGGGSATLLSWRLVIHGTREYPLSARSARIQSPYESDRSSCHPECKSDQPCGNADTTCTACRHYKQELLNGQFRCVSICPEGTYSSDDGEEKQCLPCHWRCAACRNASEISCVSCKSGYYLIHDETTCVESCPKQYYTDKHLRKCVRCKTDCASCDTSSHLCSSCPDGYGLQDANCVKTPQTCSSREYFDFDKSSCQQCDPRCSTCTGPRSDQCRSCAVKSNYAYLQDHSCVPSCSSGFYPSPDRSQCLPCHESCLTCTSSNELACTSCRTPYVYLSDEHRCEKHLGKPYYLDKATGQTHTCHASCAQCKGPAPMDCTACLSSAEVLLGDGYCVSECPPGSFPSEKTIMGLQSAVCLPCSVGCTLCTNVDQCQRCDAQKGYTLVSSRCMPRCPSGFLATGDCQPCQLPCSTCTNRTSCLICTLPLVLFNSQCLDKCPDGYYAYNEGCVPCHPSCRSCEGASEDDCQACATGFVFNDNDRRCLSLCPNGNYFDRNDDKCRMCTDRCFDCFSPGSYCRQCTHPMALDTLTHRCLSCCPTNTTTTDCCQCPSSWDGFCLHPLARLSTHATPSWIQSSMDEVRDKFHNLNGTHRILAMVALSIVLLSMAVCLLTLCIRPMLRSRSSARRNHDNVEYVILQNVDDADDDQQLHATVIRSNGLKPASASTDRTLSIDEDWTENER